MYINLPEKVDIRYDHVKINEKYTKYYIVQNYINEINMFDSFNDVYKEPETELIICTEMLDGTEYVKAINSQINNNRAEIISSSVNQLDKEIVKKAVSDAEKLKYKVQVEGEGVYKVTIIIAINGFDKQLIEIKGRKIASLLYAKGIVIKPANFRQSDAMKLSLLNCNLNIELFKRSGKIFTTTSLALLFPMYTLGTVEVGGVIIGVTQGKYYGINLFHKSHLNSNLCVFGSSGSGKSYFIKSLILKNLYQNINQIVFDPEGEYEVLAQNLGGRVILQDSFNILYIHEQFAKQTNKFLYEKIKNIVKVLEVFTGDSEIITSLKHAITNAYSSKGINNNISSLYKDPSNNNLIFLNPRYREENEFPTIKEVEKQIYILKLSKKQESNAIAILEKLKSTCCGFAKKYGNEKLTVFGLKKLRGENLEKAFYIYLLLLDEFLEEQTIIYIDEVWKILQCSNSLKPQAKVAEIYKTVRKKKAGIVIITQEISDVLSFNGGEFGKTILNNSYIKAYFKMEYTDIEKLSGAIKDTSSIDKIKSLDKGSAIIDTGGACIEVQVKNQEFEDSIITEVKYSEKNNNRTR